MATSLSAACIASNQEHVYYLSRESDGWLVLVKSERFPRTFAEDAWSIVSMVEPDQLNRLSYPDMRYFEDIDCSVDDDGVFSFRSRRDNFAYHYRYDPRERFVPSRSYCNPPNSVGGWTQQSLKETDEVAYRKKIVIQPPVIGTASNRTGDSMMIYYPHTQEQLPLKGPPTIQLGYFNTTEPSYIRSRDLVHVSLVNVGSILDKVILLNELSMFIANSFYCRRRQMAQCTMWYMETATYIPSSNLGHQFPSLDPILSLTTRL